MHLNIFVSPKCFLHCDGCYSYSREENCNSFANTNIIVNFLSYAYNYGINKVTFCGGDPLTRLDIIDLLRRVKDIGYIISIDTVGTNLISNIYNNRGYLLYNQINPSELAKYVDVIGIPIDGSNSEIINLFRKSKDDILSEQLLICKKLSEYKIKICINTVVHKGNVNDSLELSKIMNRLDFIEKWQLFKFIPSGKFGMLNKNKFFLTQKEFKEFEKVIKENYKYEDRLQFKDEKVRNKLYMMIDNSGNAWKSIFENEKVSGIRNIVGNIKRKEDWDNIIHNLNYINDRGDKNE